MPWLRNPVPPELKCSCPLPMPSHSPRGHQVLLTTSPHFLCCSCSGICGLADAGGTAPPETANGSPGSALSLANQPIQSPNSTTTFFIKLSQIEPIFLYLNHPRTGYQKNRTTPTPQSPVKLFKRTHSKPASPADPPRTVPPAKRIQRSLWPTPSSSWVLTALVLPSPALLGLACPSSWEL